LYSLLTPNNILLTGCKFIPIFNFDSIQLETFFQKEAFIIQGGPEVGLQFCKNVVEELGLGSLLL